MIHIGDVLLLAAAGVLGAMLNQMATDRKNRAVRAEREQTEYWRRAYTELRYSTAKVCPATDNDAAPAPLQLNENEAWASRINGKRASGARARA